MRVWLVRSKRVKRDGREHAVQGYLPVASNPQGLRDGFAVRIECVGKIETEKSSKHSESVKL